MIVSTGAATHPGLRRALNEDAHLASPPVFVVADGMGGHEAGERASAAVIAEFASSIGRASLHVDDVRHALSRARSVVEQLSLSGDVRAGTTLSGVVIATVDGMGYWLAVNIGDSRTYRLADGALEQISVDHSVVQELIDAGELTAEQAMTDRRRNVITRAIGASSTGDADYWLFPAELGDRMMVCSDGLTSEVSDARILEVLAHTADPQDAAERLVEDAVAAGGRDNITVVIVDAVSVASRPRTYLETDSDTHTHVDVQVDITTRPREAATGGAR